MIIRQRRWLQAGWAAIRNFDPDGKLHTGWLKLDGKQYYFYQAGDMATGKMTIGNGEYYFDENGVLQSGFAIPQAPSLYE